MGVRFDELELTFDPAAQTPPPNRARITPTAHSNQTIPAARYRRIFTCLIDLSLLGALGLALSPLISEQGGFGPTISQEWPSILALTGFLLMVSCYYYVGSWVLWGKTIGGAIFDVKVVDLEGLPISFSNATRRWAFSLLSLVLAGLGFALAGLPHRRSLPDIFSGSQCVMDEKSSF